jgi:hypothetical protein
MSIKDRLIFPLMNSAYNINMYICQIAHLVFNNNHSLFLLQNEEDKDPVQQDVGKKKERKEQLTKNQKRKMYEKLNAAGEKPRGYDWVDIIKHLSQTGGQT